MTAQAVEPAPAEPEVASRHRQRRWPDVAGLTLVVAVIPLATALAAVRKPHWYPEMDLALTEMLVRDTGTAHPPLVGLIGRVYGLGVRGHHPGPLSFFLLAPVYRLFGGTAWALQVATATLNAAAMATAIWIGHRRGGRLAATGVAAVVGIVALEYGTSTLTQAWNPDIPLLWWFVLLLAVWSVLCDDLALLPVAVFAGSLCLQTHVSYLGLVAGMAGALAVALAVEAWRRRDDRTYLRRITRWAGTSLGLLAALWLPPLLQQFRRSPGNLAVIADSFVHPESPPLGIGRSTVQIWLSYLDVSGLLGYGGTDPIFARQGAIAPGLVLLATWATAAAWTWRQRLGRDLVALHLTVGVALAVGLVSMTRIQGGAVFWVVLWAWGTTAWVLVAIGWTAAVTVRRHVPPERRRLAGRASSILVAGTLAVVVVAFTYQGAHTVVFRPDVSRAIGHLAPPAAASLDEDGRYVLRWSSNIPTAGLPYGALLELERRGIDIGAVRVADIPYRVRQPDAGTRYVDYVSGQETIDRFRAAPDATELAYYDDPGLGPLALFLRE